MSTIIRDLREIMTDPESLPSGGWNIKSIQSDQCVSYVAWNTEYKEAIVIDPKDEDANAYESLFKSMKDYLWIAVIDTHTHADHISYASDLSKKIGAPYVMSEKVISPRIDLRVSPKPVAEIPARSGPIRFISTPGHTPDSLTILWGPYIFGGDTVLYGDVGRDDLPGGSPESHYESLRLLRSQVSDSMILLPGHDHKGGRASSWKVQMEKNTSLTQDRESFVKEAAEFDAPAPALLKKSLRENFK